MISAKLQDMKSAYEKQLFLYTNNDQSEKQNYDNNRI